MDSLPHFSNELWQLLGAVLSGTVGAKLLDYWIKYREKKTQQQDRFAGMTIQEHAQEERAYRAEIRQENKEIRELLRELTEQYRALEKMHQECEDDRAQVRAELYLNRQKLQLLQFKVDELEAQNKNS